MGRIDPEVRKKRNVAIDGEHPDVIFADILRWPRPAARVVVVANEKGGAGKSTVAFHLCIALANTGYATVAIDLDIRQRTLSRCLGNRDALARRLGISLPSPHSLVLEARSGGLLCQEINRIGWHRDVVVIDVAGGDSPIARRAIALADTLITPVNTSFIDLDLLGRQNPDTLDVTAPGCFAETVNELRSGRIQRKLPDIDWIVVPNRVRRGVSHNQNKFDSALLKLAANVGFRLGHGLSERVAYRELFMLGLTYLDLKRLPQLIRTKFTADMEIPKLMTDLGLESVASRRRRATMVFEALSESGTRRAGEHLT